MKSAARAFVMPARRFSMNRSWIIAASMLGLALVAAPACAANARDGFTGSWQIDASEPAPWLHTPAVGTADEIKRLVGARIVFKADRIDGPDPLACRKPHYQLHEVQASELFNGALVREAEPATDPEKAADKIGFGKRPIKTLDSGCGAGIDFHAIDAGHAVFALNDNLYRISRVVAPKNRRKP
jgi:hypothetical protein